MAGQLFHLSSVLNRASIERFGLDGRRMTLAFGLAGASRSEIAGVYVFEDIEDARWFAGQAVARHPAGLDLWEITPASDLGEEAQLVLGSHGYRYVPGVVEPARVKLVETFEAAGAQRRGHSA